MSTYSAFFSSGLLAPHHGQGGAVSLGLPSSPMPMLSSPADPIDRDTSLTPTPSSFTFPGSFDPPNNNAGTGIFMISTNSVAGAERPRLRKRRSSLTVSTGSMAHIKSPSRSATNAFQRTGVLSPTRSRSGSLTDGGEGMGYALGVATEGRSSFVGRMRSGSLTFGGSFRTRRPLRKATSPAAPPPTAPLPDLPLEPKGAGGAPANVPQLRRPLAERFYSVDNCLLPSPLLGHDFASKMTLSSSPTTQLESIVDDADFFNPPDELMEDH